MITSSCSQLRGAARRRATGRSVTTAAAAGGFVIALALAGCGSSKTSSSSATQAAAKATTATKASGSSSSNASAAADIVAAHRKPSGAFVDPGPALNAKSVHGKALWFIPVSSTIAAVPPEAAGVQQAAAALGMTYHTCDGNFIPATESACIEQAVNAGAAGIITDAIDPTTVSTGTAYAAAHHVPTVVLADVGTSSKWLRFVPSGDVQSEPIAADWIAAAAGSNASVIAATVSGDKGTVSEASLFISEMKKQCPSCTVYNVPEGPSSSTDYTQAVSSMLLRHPTVKYAFAQFDFIASPVERGIQEAGHNLKVVSTTGVFDNLKAVKDGGAQVADVAVNPNYYGWVAVDTLLRLMLHKPAAVHNTLPIRVFDKTNINSVPLSQAAADSGALWGSLAYRKDFQKLWGLG